MPPHEPAHHPTHRSSSCQGFCTRCAFGAPRFPRGLRETQQPVLDSTKARDIIPLLHSNGARRLMRRLLSLVSSLTIHFSSAASLGSQRSRPDLPDSGSLRNGVGAIDKDRVIEYVGKWSDRVGDAGGGLQKIHWVDPFLLQEVEH